MADVDQIQLDLFPTRDVLAMPKGATIEDRFREFDAANPHVYEALVDLCRRVQARGRKRWSINAAFEVPRYRWTMQTIRREGEFKLNNNFRAYYARMIEAQEPELAGFFELRESAADGEG